MAENRKVTYKHLKKGQEIKGTESGSCSSGFTAYVKDVNPAFVAVEMWRPGGSEEKIDSEAMFLVEMTDEEIRAKYNDKAGEIVQNIQIHLLRDEIGYHEMCNSWLSSDPWELAQECAGRRLSVLGYCKDIIPKMAMISRDILDVGVCVETEDGDRFWCYFRSGDIWKLVRRYERYQGRKAKRQ